ncbi:N-acetyllactosaminide beta-1 6-N-acetylglucosaminyl-transferase isoform C [Biomphalaria pfeifferi]|uniref:N-acetyllactosaminide beta-1 6-N-acetylglucosaminyl-transferase isoform C n=1 Tax=Biomphalaria pfeifferi TaxID=112525 RepID=A0AAD8FBN9_BIOPF|nr:N-acetyllactosaminide beta-1 6-N-acetylglucosaminyl-transferase isoform C [Biomphalaria pfeifferi]
MYLKYIGKLISYTRIFRKQRIGLKIERKKTCIAIFILVLLLGWLCLNHSYIAVEIRPASVCDQPREMVKDWIFQTDHLKGFKKKWVGFPDLVDIDCHKAFSRNAINEKFPQEVRRTFPEDYLILSRKCQEFRENMGFYRYPAASQEEKEFPLAFVLLIHKDLDQVLFLLRAIYRPHNVYCLSVDTKSSVQFLDAVRSVSRCLTNVFVASKLENIVYAGFSRLQADLNCFKDLLDHPVKWKYAINMPGQQFPLRTNLEVVNILKHYNGSNDIEYDIRTVKEDIEWRTSWIHSYLKINKTDRFELVKTNIPHSPVPHGLKVVKGSAYGSFSRKFIAFVLSSPIALDVLEWSQKIYSPDEIFWSTLNYANNLSVPGGSSANSSRQSLLKLYRTSYATWEWSGPCSTKYIRNTCIYATEDLHRLKNRQEFFLNKFDIEHHPTALHCLDQLIYNITFLTAVPRVTSGQAYSTGPSTLSSIKHV